jgi:hypothetical protein
MTIHDPQGAGAGRKGVNHHSAFRPMELRPIAAGNDLAVAGCPPYLPDADRLLARSRVGQEGSSHLQALDPC